jgi:hypothetical protein
MVQNKLQRYIERRSQLYLIMSFVDNYKYGCFLSNHCKVDEGLLKNVVPFEVCHHGDEQVPLPHCSVQKQTMKISRHAKFVCKTQNKTKIYNLNVDKFDGLLGSLTTTNKCHSLQHIILNHKDPLINDYIVKVIPVKRWRDIHTAEKELHMTEMVYNSSQNGLHGSDITCKPFFGCLFWSGKKWKYVSVFERANGVSVNKVRKPWVFKKGFNKSKILKSVADTVRTLWMLGYAHNDLHDANLCYDAKTNKTKIIDFEMAVKLPSYIADELSNVLRTNDISDVAKITEEDCNEFARVFYNNAKDMAISLLSLAKEVCYVNADADGIIYNTDDNILPLLFARL